MKFLCYFILLAPGIIFSQVFSRYDSLKGGDVPAKTSFNVTHYDLDLRIDPRNRSIMGSNQIHFSKEFSYPEILLDLDHNLTVDSIYVDQAFTREWIRDSSLILISFPAERGTLHKVTIYYHGTPREAVNAPWDGGIIWEQDSLGRDWLGVACQGEGASLWWPVKEDQSDEPDSVLLTYELPDHLTCAANGELMEVSKSSDGWTSWKWRVAHPINNYNITFNAAEYSYFRKNYYTTEGRQIPLEYYVLDYNLRKAKNHFEQVGRMLDIYEQLMGPYPFTKDGFKLIETPYWGMEHQSAIAYGNDYQNNSFGFDFIIIHESGHEYWGNSITAADPGELWIHEAFTTYLETLFLEKWKGRPIAQQYLNQQKSRIKNQQAIQGPLGVHFHGWEDADMYYKGAWMLHSIRNMISADSLWFDLWKNLYLDHEMQVVNSVDIINYFENFFGHRLSAVFDHYLKEEQPPILEIKNEARIFYARWANTDPAFNMPVSFWQGNERMLFYPKSEWQKIDFSEEQLIEDDFYYITKIL